MFGGCSAAVQAMVCCNTILTPKSGEGGRLPHTTIAGADEEQAKGRADRPRLAQEEERGPHQVCYSNPSPSCSALLIPTAQTFPRYDPIYVHPYYVMQLKHCPEITRRIDEAKRKMGRVMQIAAFSLAEVTYAVGGDIGYQIQESAKQARFRVRTKQENVSGVFLPQFESFTTEGNNDFSLTGLGKGGQQVQRCRETYARAVETLVELASLQTAFVILDEVIKVVNRRVNAMLVSHIHSPKRSHIPKPQGIYHPS
jgi:H(+)-transporting ATP synthase subunit D